MMRASITCAGRGIRKLFRSPLAELGLVLLLVAGLGACREPELRIVSSSLALRVLPACEPERLDRVLVEPLGDFGADAQSLVSVALDDAPVVLSQLPLASQWYRLSVETDFRGAALGRAGRDKQRFDALLLPFSRSCAVLDQALPALEQSARALVTGTDLLLAGGAIANNASQAAWLLRVAEPELLALGDDKRALRVPRMGAAAVGQPDGAWLLGGASVNSPGIDALDSLERYDAASASFSLLPGRLRESRYTAAAVRLPDGAVLVAGGFASVGGEPLTSIETLSADAASSELWDVDNGALRFAAVELSLHLRDDGRVVAFGVQADHQAQFALLDPALREQLTLRSPSQSESLRLGAGVALPGGRFAVFELVPVKRPPPNNQEEVWRTNGRMQLLFEGETSFVTLSDWLGSFDGLAKPRALALANGRVLLVGLRADGEPALRILDLGNREVTSRALDLDVDDVFMREDGSVLLAGKDGARVLREDALSAFDNPGGTLTADDSDVLCLDTYGRFTREGLGLRAQVRGARFDLAPLRYERVRVDLTVEGEAQLLLRPEQGDARLIDLGAEKFGPGFCQLSVEPGAPLSLTRDGAQVTLHAGKQSRSCELEGIVGSIALGLIAVQPGTLVRELRAQRL